MTDYLKRAENEIAKLYAENANLRTENIQLKNEMMSRWIEKMTGDRYEFHGELGDKVPALTSDDASLLILRGALHAATAEVGKLRAEIENEQLKEQINLTVLNANQIEMKRLRAENEQTREINQLRVQATDKLRADNERLRTALEPFARKVDAESLFMALAHITREDLLRARDAMGGKP